MKLSDIIKTDKDRLFIVDTECFIIFTGTSLEDDKPFIRIGTWIDLPVSIIPLVENIIITDKILGNPAIEQFNINIRELSSNRYIGSESILKRFTEYQRNFGLDLTNVSLVNIEKDIPELTDKKNISGRDQFIGVFYSDGNVKILHDGNDIFDLNTIYKENITFADIIEKISLQNKASKRYNGTGFVVADKNPLFYSGGYLTSYQFPKNCISYFSDLAIDPNKIREILIPLHNIIPVSEFIKFKHMREGKVKIFSNETEQLELIKKLFKNATIQSQSFSDMNYIADNGLSVSSYDGTPNIKVNFKAENKDYKNLSLQFIKSPLHIKSILKEPADAIIISYTAYEQSVLLFKSINKPVIILNDGNPNISKISDSDHIILNDCLQYETRHYENEDSLIRSIPIDEEIKEALEKNDISLLESLLKNQEITQQTLFNAISLLKIKANSTKDRKLYSSYKSTIQKFKTPAKDLIDKKYKNFFIEIAICKSSAYEIIRELSSNPEEIFVAEYSQRTIEVSKLNKEQLELAKKIIEDRKRLEEILRLFYQEKELLPSFSSMKKELDLLKKEIDNRKDIYESEIFTSETKIKKLSKEANTLKEKITGKLKTGEEGDLTLGCLIIKRVVRIICARLWQN